jgi:signal peptidase I
MSHASSVPANPAAALKCDLAGEVLRSSGSLHFSASGWSMLPTIWPGDTVLVEHVSPSQIQVGDVALIARHGRLCGHRVIVRASSERSHWITQGDAVPHADSPASESELLGRVTHVIRAGECVALTAKRDASQRLASTILRFSSFMARTVAYLHGAFHSLQKSAA